MKKLLIITGIILSVLILVAGGFALFMISGLSDTEQFIIGSIDTDIPDGTYQGEYNGGRFSNKVAVTVNNKKIIKIDVIKAVTLEREDVTQKLIGDVIISQSTQVDEISGATVTAKAYLRSIENALEQKEIKY